MKEQLNTKELLTTGIESYVKTCRLLTETIPGIRCSRMVNDLTMMIKNGENMRYF